MGCRKVRKNLDGTALPALLSRGRLYCPSRVSILLIRSTFPFWQGL